MEKTSETITVNGKTYYAHQPQDYKGDIKIVVLQRGWVLIGKVEKSGENYKIHNPSVIRNWGTTKGLGELVHGPTSSTKLDKCFGIVEFHELTKILSLDVDESKWQSKL